MKANALRFPLMMLAALTLLAAMWGGLVRLGWALPPLGRTWVGNHGPLMISGFLGILISLERAVALGALRKLRWPFLGPALAALGAALILAGLPREVGRALLFVSSLLLGVMFVIIYRARPDWAHAAMSLGAACWIVGNGLWLFNQLLARAVPWWVGFLLLTIAGERLELSRVLKLTGWALRSFVVSVLTFLAGLVVSLIALRAGVRLAGLGLIALGLWLLLFDVARRTLRLSGLTRYIAFCLLPGYFWLVFAGGLWLARADQFSAGPLYDAMLHSLLLGYVFSMIFGHAPLIVPATMGVGIRYRPAFYAHLLLLQLGLVLRIAGDLLPHVAVRQWGGLVNVLAILLFLFNTVRSVERQIQFTAPA